MEISNNKYIRFDWAVKRMLRDKANFAVLEGLITVLLDEKVTITEILESEGNQEQETDKFNRVDIMAKNSKDEIIIVEVQLSRQLYYLQRILYGVSKAITDYMSLGDKYDKVKKVYSISIIYFDLGQGKDYLYHGKTKFQGVHVHDSLMVNQKENSEIKRYSPDDVFPEYFIIRVNEFNDVATTPLEEWLDYLKNNRINDTTTAPGLQEAREKLRYMTMSTPERQAYDRHIDAIMTQNDVLDTYKQEGLEEGRKIGIKIGKEEGIKEGIKEGIERGRAEQIKADALKMKELGIEAEVISQVTGLSPEEIASL
ncbi:MAG: PD-(D/E)XK nuclease family transposase [Lepagella sp.]